MKEIIVKILNNKQVSITELNSFIVEYCKLCVVKEPNKNELSLILALIKQRVFSLHYACENALKLLKIDYMKVYNVDGELIKIEIK